MNADKRRWLGSFLLLTTLATCSTSNAEEAAFQLTTQPLEKKTQDANPLSCHIPWTFALSQAWEEEQEKVLRGWDGFMVTKMPNLEVTYLLAFTPDRKLRTPIHIHPLAVVDNHI